MTHVSSSSPVMGSSQHGIESLTLVIHEYPNISTTNHPIRNTATIAKNQSFNPIPPTKFTVSLLATKELSILNTLIDQDLNALYVSDRKQKISLISKEFFKLTNQLLDYNSLEKYIQRRQYKVLTSLNPETLNTIDILLCTHAIQSITDTTSSKINWNVISRKIEENTHIKIDKLLLKHRYSKIDSAKVLQKIPITSGKKPNTTVNTTEIAQNVLFSQFSPQEAYRHQEENIPHPQRIKKQKIDSNHLPFQRIRYLDSERRNLVDLFILDQVLAVMNQPKIKWSEISDRIGEYFHFQIHSVNIRTHYQVIQNITSITENEAAMIVQLTQLSGDNPSWEIISIELSKKLPIGNRKTAFCIKRWYEIRTSLLNPDFLKNYIKEPFIQNMIPYIFYKSYTEHFEEVERTQTQPQAVTNTTNVVAEQTDQSSPLDMQNCISDCISPEQLPEISMQEFINQSPFIFSFLDTMYLAENFEFSEHST